MRKNILTAAKVLLVSSLLASTAWASDDTLNACLKDNDSNMGMKTCVDQELKIQDTILNREYASLKALLAKDKSEDGKEILNRIIKSQRAWMAMRDTTCAVEGIEMLGGTGEGLIILGCLNRMTTERVSQIKEMRKYAGTFE